MKEPGDIFCSTREASEGGPQEDTGNIQIKLTCENISSLVHTYTVTHRLPIAGRVRIYYVLYLPNILFSVSRVVP